ncbi:MAG: hypothetical protein K2Z81_11300 [Cyanobacteria bacterium]|nr:hypothetical protein [Cyanobacteriota bacterium]
MPKSQTDSNSSSSTFLPESSVELPVQGDDVKKKRPSNPPRPMFPVKEVDSESVVERSTDDLLEERVEKSPAPLQGSASNTEVSADAIRMSASPLSRYRGDSLVFFKVHVKNDGDVPVLVLGNNICAAKPTDADLAATKPLNPPAAPTASGDALPLRQAIVDPTRPGALDHNLFKKPQKFKLHKHDKDADENQVTNKDLLATSEAKLEKRDNTLLSPVGKAAVGVVGVGTLGLAGPIFYELMTPSENGKRDLGIALGRDRGRHEVEGERMGVRLIMPGDETTGWVAFGDGENLRTRKRLFVPVMFPPYSQVSRTLEISIDWAKVAVENSNSGKDVRD